MTLEQWMADHTIDNNGSLEELQFNVQQLIQWLEHINNGADQLISNLRS